MFQVLKRVIYTALLGTALCGLCLGAGAYWAGGYLGWRGGRYEYGHEPYYYSSYPSYSDYGSSSASSSSGVTRSSFYAASDSGGDPQVEPPYPTSIANPVAPPDAGLILLRVPDPFAEVFFNGQKTSSVGTTRAYVTPALPPGTHQYTVTATWGQMTREKKMVVARGRVSRVDFTAAPEDQAK